MGLNSNAAEMLRTMARMQEAHNAARASRVADAGIRVLPGNLGGVRRAARSLRLEMVEAAARGHVDQVKLEIVDIWHFALSDLIRAGTLSADLATQLDFEPDGG